MKLSKSRSNFVRILLFVILSLGVVKWGQFLANGKYFEAVVWPVLLGWISWLLVAIGSNKDMPHWGGDFRYKDGKNQTARFLYLGVMLVIFLYVMRWE